MGDIELSEAVKWYIERYGKRETTQNVFETYLCGYFHTYPRNARFILHELENLGLISVFKGNVRVC